MTLASEFWAADRGAHAEGWIDLYWASADSPHRVTLIQELARQQPASVLEVGCHCGVNLRLLARTCPECRLAGFDISGEAIREGHSRLSALGIAADLRVGRAPEALQSYADGSVEWPFSCYALAYLDPQDIRVALREMWRIGSKGIAIFEPTVIDPDVPKIFYRRQQRFEEWWHPYVTLMMQEPTMNGALATIHEMRFPDNALNALIVVQR